MLKKFFICFMVLNASAVFAIPEWLKTCCPCLVGKTKPRNRNQVNKYIQEYVTVTLNPVYEEQYNQRRRLIDRFLDWVATKRVKRKK